MMRHALFLALFLLTACCASEDALEPNNDVAHATVLPLGETRDAIVILGNDDLYTTTPGPVSTLRWHLALTGHERAARIELVGADGVLPTFPYDPVCSAPDAPLPHVLCASDGSFDLDAVVAEGESGVVVIHQPALCADCFTPESTTYTLSVHIRPTP